MPNFFVDVIEKELLEPFSFDQVLFHAKYETPAALTQTVTNPIERRTSRTAEGKSPREHYDSLPESGRETKDGLVLALRNRADELQLQVPFLTPVWAMFLFFYSPSVYYNSSGLVSQRTPALIKLINLTTDCLTRANILSSSQLIQSHDGSRKLLGKTNAIEIFLMPYDIEKNGKKFRGAESGQV